MSSTIRRPAAEVTVLVEEFTTLIAPHCAWLSVGGSLRRKKSEVGDVEIVITPKPSYFEFLDRLVESGTIEKARYGAKLTTRWGLKYRGLNYKSLRLELFCCDEDNRGYMLWLRTGPDNKADRANTTMMTAIKLHAPFHVNEGYVYANERRLRIETEEDWFALIGIPYLPPEERTAATYTKLLRGHAWGDPARFTERQHALIQASPARMEAPRGAAPKKAKKAGVWDWEPPWLDSEQVWIHVGYGEWELRDPADPLAQFMFVRLRGDESFRDAQRKRLQAWLDSRASRMRIARAESAMRQLIDILREVRHAS